MKSVMKEMTTKRQKMVTLTSIGEETAAAMARQKADMAAWNKKRCRKET